MCIKETDICSLHWDNKDFRCVDGDASTQALDTILVNARNHSMCTASTIKCLHQEFKCRKPGGGFQCLAGTKLYDGKADCYNPTLTTSATNSSLFTKIKSLSTLIGKTDKASWNTTEYPDDENPELKKIEDEKKTSFCSCPTSTDMCSKSKVFSYSDTGHQTKCDCRCVECFEGYAVFGLKF